MGMLRGGNEVEAESCSALVRLLKDLIGCFAVEVRLFPSLSLH